MKIDEILDIITGSTGVPGMVCVGVVVVLWGVELWFWLRRYGRIAKFRNKRRAQANAADGVSVVVIVGDDFGWLEHTLPRLMAQTYEKFELVVMEVANSPEFSDELRIAKGRFPNLVSARIDPDVRFRVSDKMIYNIGIKTALYNNVVLTTVDCTPDSPRWLECMAKGFAHGEVVIGYCGVEPAGGAASSLIRCSRLAMSVRFLAGAIAGHPYRGMLGNVGFTKEVYLSNRGFNHLDMTMGVDDLFIQKIASRENTSIVLNPHATLHESFWGGMAGWWRQMRLGGKARAIYPAAAKRAIGLEVLLRVIFALSVAACWGVLPLYSALGATALWVVRLFVVRHQTARIGKRLGEKGLSWRMMVWDLLEPLFMTAVFISRRIKAPREVWK